MAAATGPYASIANAIFQMEGTNPNLVGNNNPGNLVYVGQPGAVPGTGGFAKFQTLQAGVQAAQDQIALDAGRGETLSQFLNKYSPANQNNTNAYIDFVSQQTGLNPDDPISLASGYSASTADTPVDTTVDTSGSMQTAAMPIDFTDPVTLAIAGLAGLLFVWLVFRG